MKRNDPPTHQLTLDGFIKKQKKPERCNIPLDIWMYCIWPYCGKIVDYLRIRLLCKANSDPLSWKAALRNVTFIANSYVNYRTIDLQAVTKLTCMFVNDDLFKYTQTVENLELVRLGFNGILNWELLASLKHLKIHFETTDEIIHSISQLVTLETLHIVSCYFSDTEPLLNLTKCKTMNLRFYKKPPADMCGLKHVEHLTLTGYRRDVMEFKYLSSIKYLDVDDYSGPINDKTIKHLSTLETLILPRRTSITNDGLQHLTLLRKLIIIDNEDITDSVFKWLPNLIHVNVAGCTQIYETGLKWLKQVEYLNVYDCPDITGDEIINLRTLKRLTLGHQVKCRRFDLSKLTNLESLVAWECNGMDGCDFSTAINLRELIMTLAPPANVALHTCCNIMKVDISGGVITDDGLIHLAKCKEIYLGPITDVTDAGIQHLQGVVDLHLSCCQKMDGSSLCRLPKLKRLRLFNCRNIEQKYLIDLRKNGVEVSQN
jgi:hypothetical protein